MSPSALVMKPMVAKPATAAKASRRSSVAVRAAGAPAMVPDMNKRNLMNLALVGAAALPIGGLVYGYGAFFIPPAVGGGTGGTVAKDAAGNDIKAAAYLASKQAGDYSLSQGLKGDPTYLIVTDKGELTDFGLNAICTHLGCVVPWISAENKFKCPCHGSQYNSQGKVIRGPAPLSLALAHVNVADDSVLFTKWTETDFRTGQDPWWA
mmetsp:Transcript_22426/g.62176  ORF Transcript_22426/g.62176 Transcript_22426/m.62176 type:complete len:208 (+) Transcript_22426:218-841(+)|eukprot:CAMPEP_0117664436 /NCGR_PEP_ID=MMETSP0804-20121206/9220_1 /TAXON_ID=1074897 /ORGANISM="Tetraselmis astigmatica, Strain CCMP880" /LENGTH=207 /DNA_ID=CAMNT_0005471671 /DNA_START=148 /DNA_END=771 /DNA_ORIENTATION=-